MPGPARLDLFADPAASEDAIGAFASAADARGYRAFRAEAKRLFTALDRPFLHATRPGPLTLGWRRAIRKRSARPQLTRKTRAKL